MKEPNKISSHEITDPKVYFNRRTFIQTGILAASAVATGLVYRQLNHPAAGKVSTAKIEGLTIAPTNHMRRAIEDGVREISSTPVC